MERLVSDGPSLAKKPTPGLASALARGPEVQAGSGETGFLVLECCGTKE